MSRVDRKDRTKPGLAKTTFVSFLGMGLAVAGFSLLALPVSAQEAVPEAGAAQEQGESPALRRRLVDATSQEQEWAPDLSMSPAEEARELVQRGDQALAGGRADDGAGGAISFYSRALQLNPNNDGARSGIDRAVAALVQRGQAAVAAGRFDEAANLSAIASRHRGQAAGVRALAETIAAGRAQAQQLSAAQTLIDQGALVEPAGANAVAIYRELLAANPDSTAARTGLERVEAMLLEQAVAAAEAGNHAQADRLLAQAVDVVPGSARVQNVGSQLAALRVEQVQQVEAAVEAAIEGGEFDRADTLLAQLDAVSVDGRSVEALRTRLDNARHYASFRPGDSLTDEIASGGEGPELVVIPLGTFMMGSPNNEPDRLAAEGPQFMVRLSRGFAMSRAPITVGEFRRFVNATGYITSAQQARRATVYDEGTGALVEKANVTWQDDHLGNRAADGLPVIHVSWNDATAYADWLARETGQRYRLPSEAEFEYALRAGGSTAYPWGNDQNPGRVVGNLTGDGDRSESRRNWSNAFANYSDGHFGPSPVRTFQPNAFGLYDMIGNVSEWVEDCWHDNYQRAPEDGSAWVNPGCNRRVLRGASWASAPTQVRSAFRLAAGPTSTNPRLGFRVVREF